MNATARKSPRGWQSYALGAAAVAVVLTATACDPSSSDDAKSSDKSSASSPAKAGETAPSKPAGGSDSTNGSTGAGNNGGDSSDAGSGSNASTGSDANGDSKAKDGSNTGSGTGTGSSAIAACDTKNLSFGMESQGEPGTDNRHFLITATNTGSTKCNLYGFPDIHFNGAREAIPVIKGSDGGEKFVTLGPGKDAGAALLMTGGNMDEMMVKNIPVRLQGPQAGSGMSATVNVDLPGEEPLAMDDGARVTAWGTATGFLLRFIMEL